MPFPYYSGTSSARKRERPVTLPESNFYDLIRPENYFPDVGLVHAVNVALTLGMPLLVTGEAGTGKTRLAYHIAHNLGFEEPLRFETKSTSTAKNLFYTFDTLGRFHAAQKTKGTINDIDFLTYNALGSAILKANDKKNVVDFLPKDFIHTGKQRSVVLIDEIDKAPRDFPNDLLTEIEEMCFRITEIKNIEIKAEKDMRPVIIITSNSEKHLPDPFLRRCVYYHIPFPDKDRLQDIVTKRMHNFAVDHKNIVPEALDFFWTLRSTKYNLSKKPSTAELLNWLYFLQERLDQGRLSLKKQPDTLLNTLSILVKTPQDIEKARNAINDWTELNQDEY
ncbi:MAG: AAA family ATPase [Candidatus Lokiarchaeota archaeon]|nr:AAA family ATPase [Candidatus Lokiarchaeota archaeon]